MRVITLVAAMVGGLFTLPGCIAAAAQDAATGYPKEPVHIIVPFSAGGATDITARIIGQKIAEEWGATIIIENKPGATGSIAAEYVAKAKPDGYTLFMGTGSVNSVNPAVKKNLPFDTLRDFVAVSNFFTTPNILVVHPSVPAKNVSEFIAVLKANPDEVQLCQFRDRQQPSHVGRTVQANGRRRDDERHLQGKRAGRGRPHRRPRQGHVRQPGEFLAVRETGIASRAWRHQRET